MRKYKQFLIGFIVAAMLFSSIGVFAEGIAVLLNPYPILVNGQAAEIEAYNINGRTFMALGDVAKYFNATAKLNEVTKEIEISTNVEGVKAMSTATAIEYDLTTGLPVGATTTEYNGCKDAILYNGNIYLSYRDLASTFDIKYKAMDVKTNTTTFGKGDIIINADLRIPGNHFLTSLGSPYYNADIFKEIIGE